MTFRADLLFLVVLLFAINGMASEETSSESKKQRFFIKASASPIPKDKKIPKSLVDRIEDDFVKHFRIVRQESPLEDHEVKRNIPRKYLKLNLKFYSDKPGVLIKDTEFDLFNAGGLIDLENVVDVGPGRFYLKMEAVRPPEEKVLDTSDVSVYFVGSGKSIKYQDGDYGSGCKKWMELTKLYGKKFTRDGFGVVSTSQRYVSLIAGTYYFVHFHAGTLYLSFVELTDSRYPELMCRG